MSLFGEKNLFSQPMPPQLSLIASVFLVVASMLGSGILTTTGSILGLVKTPDAVMLVWLVAGTHAVLGAICYGLIVKRTPVNGGEASILRTYFSPALGEIAGWVSFIVGFAASNAATAIGFGAYLGKVHPLLLEISPTGKLAAMLAILTVTLLHSATGTLGMRTQTAMAALKFILLGSLTAWGLFHAPVLADAAPQLSVSANGGTLGPPPAFGPAWGLAVMISMFAYLGWSAAIYSAGETREARHTVPRAMLCGTCFVLALYIGVNLVLLKHLPLGELVQERAVMELFVRRSFGPGASSLFSGVVSFALLSSLGASAFLGPRVLQTLLSWVRPAASPDQPSNANPATRVSGTLVWIQAALSIAMILSGSFEQILTVTGFLLGIFPMLSVLGLYTRAANEPAKVHVLVRFFAAPLFIAGSLLILVMGGREKPIEMAISTAVLIVIFFLRRSLRQSPPCRTQ
jgi:APA family basic amino acid/polyamine antiporter